MSSKRKAAADAGASQLSVVHSNCLKFLVTCSFSNFAHARSVCGTSSVQRRAVGLIGVYISS